MRVLIVTSRYPLPPWRGNQVRTLDWLEALAEDELLLVCPSPDEYQRGDIRADVRHYGSSLGSGIVTALTRGRPIQEGLYDGWSSRRAVAAAVEEWQPDVVVVQMVRCAWAVEVIRDVAQSTPLVFDAIDAMGLQYDRAAQTMLWLRRAAYQAEAGRCRRREQELVGIAEITTAVSERDLSALGVPCGWGRVVPVIGRDYPREFSVSKAPVILLSGNLGYRPTVRGALWFVREVWPSIRSHIPTVRWMLAGARPTAAVRRLGDLPGIEVHADVPDLGAFLSKARVAIAPLSSGSGVPMKVLEAMAAGVPVVADPWAAAGLEDPKVVVSALSAKEWVVHLTRLLSDQGAASELADRGRELWQRVYSREEVAKQIRAAIDAASANRRVRGL